MLRHLRSFIQAHIWHTLLGLAILMAIDALQLVTPKIIGDLADGLASKNIEQSQIYRYMFWIFGIAVLVAIGRYWWRILINGTSRKAEYWIRNKIFAHLETLSWQYFSQHKVGDIMALATNDVTAVGAAMGMGLVMLIDAVFMSILTIVMMVINIDAKLTFIAVVPMPLIAILVGYGGKLMRKRFKRVQEAFSHMTDQVQESFSGVRIIKTYTREAHHRQLFETTNQENFDENMKLVRLWGMMFPLVKTIAAISLIITLLYGGFMVIDKEITIGMFVAFISYIGMLTWPMMAIGWVVNVMERGVASMKRINEFLDTAPDFGYGDKTLEPVADGTGPVIEIKDLHFAYPETERCVLQGSDLTVERGQKVGIIGKTGSGKTTLVNLITKAWAVADGQIYIEGEDVNRLSKEAIKNHFGVVPQDNFLFSRNIEDNIRFFEKDRPFEAIQAAAKTANVHNEILGFSQEYDTLLGERGVNLSGGQKQRIGIARALLKRSEVIVFDDALSAVDTKTEESILRHLKEALTDRTAIIIAHRISAIKDCDQIFVLDEGKIVERGTHDTLIGGSGLYRHIYDKQQLEEKIAEE